MLISNQKPCNIKSAPAFKGSPPLKNISNKIAGRFAKMGEIGEGASIACDFLGKALVVPAVIMASSNEPTDKKEYSAFKNPVAAVIQLALEVPVLLCGSKIVGNLANKGFFDKQGSDFSYNEKQAAKNFVDAFEKENLNTDRVKSFISKFKETGYNKQLAEDFADVADTFNGSVKNELKNSFAFLEKTHKNQFHLKNRVCFVAALLLTPILCAIENNLHPKIMDFIYKERDKHHKMADFHPEMGQFIQKTKGRA